MRVISVTGGKGGVGKTTLAVNLAVAYAKAKKKVLLFDADLSLANVDVMLGLHAPYNLNDYLSGKCELKDICITGPHGLKIIPAASGVQKMSELSLMQSNAIIQAFSHYTDDLDMMIVDMAPGISNQVMHFTHASQDILLVVCNEPASLMDSYAVIKILHQKYARNRFGVIVNKVKNLQEGYSVFSQFQKAVDRFVDVNMNYLGHIPNDDYVNFAAREGRAIIDRYPQSPSATAMRELCHGINHWQIDAPIVGGIQFFFERLIKGMPLKEEVLCKV